MRIRDDIVDSRVSFSPETLRISSSSRIQIMLSSLVPWRSRHGMRTSCFRFRHYFCENTGRLCSYHPCSVFFKRGVILRKVFELCSRSRAGCPRSRWPHPKKIIPAFVSIQLPSEHPRGDVDRLNFSRSPSHSRRAFGHQD